MGHELWTASCVLLLLGFLCGAAGAALGWYRRSREMYRGHAEARVVELAIERKTGEASLSEFRNRQVAVFEFYAGGKLIKVRDKSDVYPCPYYMNQRVRICYDPADPQQFQIEERSVLQLAEKLLQLACAGLILAGAVAFLMYASRAEL